MEQFGRDAFELADELAKAAEDYEKMRQVLTEVYVILEVQEAPKDLLATLERFIIKK